MPQRTTSVLQGRLLIHHPGILPYYHSREKRGHRPPAPALFSADLGVRLQCPDPSEGKSKEWEKHFTPQDLQNSCVDRGYDNCCLKVSWLIPKKKILVLSQKELPCSNIISFPGKYTAKPIYASQAI